MKLRTGLVLLAGAGMLAGPPAGAAIDGLEAARSQSYEALRWENIRGGPGWISGAPPVRDPAAGWHAVDLAGAASVVIQVPAHALLRVIAAAPGPAQPPVFAISHGTGIGIEREPVRGADGRSWLLRNDSAQSAVIHLRAAGTTATAQRFALFVGQFAAPAEPVAYRHAVALPLPAVAVRRADQAVAQDHVQVGAGQELRLTLRGPDRLLLEYRLAAPEAPGTALVSLEATVDSLPARIVRQPTGPETVAPVQVNGAWQAMGRLERVAIDLPPGDHVVSLRPTHTVLLRGLLALPPDFQLPNLNLPPQWRSAAGDAGIEEVEQTSIAAAASNRWRDSGLVAAQRLQRQARLRPAMPALVGAADELVGQFTEFQNLAPATAHTVRTRSVWLQQPQPLNDAVRHRIVGPVAAAATEPLGIALFHRVGVRAVRFDLPAVSHPVRIRALVPLDAAATRIELREGGGPVGALVTGLSRLPDDRLRPSSALSSTLASQGWPPTLSGHADRGGAVAPLLRMASVEWQLPANTTSLTLQVPQGQADVALQWSSSPDYFLDDEFLARLVPGAGASQLDAAQRQDAMQPLERMLAAAREQFIANSVAPAAPGPRRDEAGARAAARAAAAEPEPARAVELWQQALQTGAPPVQAEALRGLANALFAAGERFGGERLLRSHWIGADPALARVAQTELDALYRREDDRAMQLLFTAAKAARDPAGYGALSAALAADGEDRLALLSGLAAPVRDLPALLQSALRDRRWQTFEALLQLDQPPAQRAHWQAQRALSNEPLATAAALLSSAVDPAWSAALDEGRRIAAALQGDPAGLAQAVMDWGAWQSRHPGPRVWRDEPDALVRHAGGITLRSVALDLRSQWWRVSGTEPLLAQVVGPARIRVVARPLHPDAASALDGWLHVRSEGQLWLMPFHQNQASPGLLLEAGAALPGAAVTREIDLPAGRHDVRIDVGAIDSAVQLLVERPALQLPVLPAPTASHFRSLDGEAGRLADATQCGGASGCELLAAGALRARTVLFEPLQWPGLPQPAAGQDPVASKLAAGDIDGALAQATDPRERMRLLLWLAQSRPSERARALALGSSLANAHPLPEIRSQWEQLSADSLWTVLPLVDRSAGLRRIDTLQGTPESPVGRIRAALLPPLRTQEVRIGGDTRATLVLAQPTATPLDIELGSDELPGVPPLPVNVRLEQRGRAAQALQLAPGEPVRRLRLQLPPGEQQVSVSLVQPLLGQFVRVRFAGPALPDPQVSRDWHIATRTQPVQVSVAGPVAVRIDRWHPDGVRSEERVLLAPQSTFVLPPQPGATESLYRIHQRVLQPVPAAMPRPRPNSYQPQPAPEPPEEWRVEPLPTPRQVRFVDHEPLALRSSGTLTLRAGLQRRHDSEAEGGGLPRVERFFETGLTWREGSEDQTQWRSADLLLRSAPGHAPVLGVRVSAERELPWTVRFPWPVTLQGSVTGFAQDSPQGPALALTARLSAYQRREITPTLSHAPRIGLMARATSLGPDSDPTGIDSDVFTRYRASHPRALVVSDTLSWRPWRDSHLAAQVSMTTNPDFNPLRPDEFGADLFWRQLIGRVIVEAGVRANRYQADAGRAASSLRSEWRLLASSDRWLRDGSRVELASELRRASDQPGYSAGVQLRWHWGARQWRDFAPSEIDFRAVRSWQIPVVRNRIEEQ